MFLYPIRRGFNLYGEFRGLKIVPFEIKVKFNDQQKLYLYTFIGENWSKTGAFKT